LLSDDEKKPPPAGGFGAGPAIARIEQRAAPVRRNHVATIAAFLAFVALIGSVLWDRWERWNHVRVSEARNTLGQIGKQVVYTYEERGVFCPSAAPVPRKFEDVRGKKYKPQGGDYEGEPGWDCIGFEGLAPQQYQYRYERMGDSFAVTAVGDLDADGIQSTFVLRGQLGPGDAGVLLEPTILETNPEE
jgi:hypothetical protein